jgi:Protein of unknown function (DUF2933)
MNNLLGGSRRWLLVAGVAAVAILLLATAGNGAGAGLWFLLVLACPLMMLFMMGSINHQAGSDGRQHGIVSGGDLPDLGGLTRDEQVRLLRGEMTRMNWRQEMLRQELERLERERPADVDTTHAARQ